MRETPVLRPEASPRLLPGLPPEHVAYPAHRLNQARVGRVFLQLLTQPAHMHVDGTCIACIVIAPHIMQDLITCQHCSPVAHEVGQQLKLLGLQLMLLPPAYDTSSRQVDAQGARYQFAIDTWRLFSCRLRWTFFTLGRILGTSH